jgi:hypothetical protein
VRRSGAVTGIPVALVAVLASCSFGPSQTPSPVPSTAISVPPSAAASASPSAEASPSVAAAPTPTPEPTLSLDPPDTRDDRVVTVSVSPNVGDEGGEIVVSVASNADSRIDDLVVRWPAELGGTLLLAPFVPSEERIRDGGDPLVQPWTKWVVGPGEHGEPAGTISLGYGPLFPGETLDVRLFVTRVAAGSVSFDLQVLAANDLLTLSDGQPAELRVEIP